MKPIALVPLTLALLSVTAVAQQTELGGKLRGGQEVVIPAGQTVAGDLYASAGTVRVEGRVDGDLVASGGQVTVAGTVTGDLLAAGGRVTISGEVGGDARVAGGQVAVERQGRVGEDLLVAAGQATLAAGARVGGDLVFGAGRMTMDGAVGGSVLGSTGSYTRGGSVAGSERVSVQERREPTVTDRLLGGLRRYLSILLVGALLLWLLPRLLRGAADAVRGRPLVSFGVGILALLVAVVALVLVILLTVLVAVVLGLLGLGSLTGVTVFAGALVAALLAFVLLVAVGFVAQAAVGLALGGLVLRGDLRSLGRAFAALALGVLVVVLVSAIPVVGGALQAIIVLLGLGALVLRRGRQDAEPYRLVPA